MKLLLARHGNTFNAGETPVRVGAREDLPLTEAGEDQARALGEAIRACGVHPNRFICGPLQRTRRHSEIVMETLGAGGVPDVDPRLTEIDYGDWGGLSDAEIVTRFGTRAEDELRAWEERSVMPTSTGQWTPSAQTIENDLRALAEELEKDAAPEDTIFICSSNGILRFFLELTEEGLASHQKAGRAKMATGSASMLEVANGIARVRFWNVKTGEALPDVF